MQSPDPEVHARQERVHELCRQLGRLLSLSLEKRKAIDRLLNELEVVTRRAGSRPAVKAAGAGRGPSRTDRP
jgi:hypothetical protein